MFKLNSRLEELMNVKDFELAVKIKSEIMSGKNKKELFNLEKYILLIKSGYDFEDDYIEKIRFDDEYCSSHNIEITNSEIRYYISEKINSMTDFLEEEIVNNQLKRMFGE